MGRLGKRKGIYDCGPIHARQSVEGGTAVGICRLGREGDPSGVAELAIALEQERKLSHRRANKSRS